MKMKDRKFSPPFLIQMCSGDTNKHCDLFPHGSLHNVKKDEDGHLWLTDRIDSIPDRFPTKLISEKPVTKRCPGCKNEFPENWTFINDGQINSKDTCIRCYERKYLVNRDVYREKIRHELLQEMGFSFK